MEAAKVEGNQLRDYELVVIISPEVTDEDVPAALEKMSHFITDRGGTITEVNQWGRRKLAYPIQQFLEGNYVLTQFKIEPKMTAELEASLRLAEEFLRHLLVRLGD
jgi:small subunit ribosomal protein S6